MNCKSFMLVVVRASFVTTLSDGFFMGVLFHGKYRQSPAIWRSMLGGKSRKVIAFSQLLAVMSCAAFAYLCLWTQALTLRQTLAAAVLVWLAGPLVVIGQLVLWIRLYPLIGASHAAGWLVRFVVTGLFIVWLYRGKA